MNGYEWYESMLADMNVSAMKEEEFGWNTSYVA